ncbi:hypothetical protein [Fibrella forsythiae]|uniref:Uncharacterized protein n=1 Tax=Fibrella forsythiae TaxID=2817061 RepID=A0ABS3JFX7_9BACT|nr:hypothetical protein [Fibrella forsythiae]MBO0948908.1 hypothetical protein [Fibrella forsythiae]
MNNVAYRSNSGPFAPWRREQKGCIILIISLLNGLLLANSVSGQSLVGAWIGVEQQIDSGFVCPLPLFLQVRSDSTYTLSLIDKAATAPRSTWGMTDNRLRLDTAVFLPGQVQITATDLKVQGATPMVFRRVQPTAFSGGETTVRSVLANRIWQQSQVRYHFHEGGQLCVEDQLTGDRAIRCWTVTECNGSVFVVVKGNRGDCSRSYDVPIQVLAFTDKKLTVSKLTAADSSPYSLTAGGLLPAGKNCEAIGFQLCSSCFYIPYEQAGLLEKKGPPGRLYAVRQQLMADFKANNVPRQTGIVQVRCLVNCEGKAGQFTATTYGPDYQRNHFDPQITNQLLTILRTHFATGWRPGRIRAIERPLDYQATITIRLVDGQITDVFL